MPAKVSYQSGPFPDRRREHAEEVAQVRLYAASAARIVFGVIGVFFAIGALLVAAANYVSDTNPLVQFVFMVDRWFEGPFSRSGGVFHFKGTNADSDRLDAIVNWVAAALAYVGIGSLLRSVLRPRRPNTRGLHRH